MGKSRGVDIGYVLASGSNPIEQGSIGTKGWIDVEARRKTTNTRRSVGDDERMN
jgi:hypothetical protein